MDAIHEIAQVNNLLVIEDAAQAHGAIKNLESKISNQKIKRSIVLSWEKSWCLGDAGSYHK
jgi:dTDP-4-amino-4,6-dideoxygalactose transaminase